MTMHLRDWNGFHCCNLRASYKQDMTDNIWEVECGACLNTLKAKKLRKSVIDGKETKVK